MEKSPSFQLTVPWLVKKFPHRWKTMFRYSVYWSPPLTLTWARSTHSTRTSYCLEIHLQLHTMLRYCKWSFSFNLPNKICAHLFSLPIRITCPAHPIPLDLITWLTFIEKCISWSSSTFSLLQSPFTSSPLDQNIPLFLSIVFSNFLAYIPPSVSEVNCQTYKRTGKIVGLYILLLMFIE